MWFGLINEIKFWFIRTFKTRKCWMPKGDVTFSWSNEEEVFGNMEKDGFDYCIKDELGGVHTDGVGYAPDGRFCGECNKNTCVGCEALKKTGAEFVVPEDQWLRDEDWVDCKNCLYHELGGCDGPESDELGCYHGEEKE